YTLPQAWGQSCLRRNLSRRGALLEAAQDTAVRTQLGRAGHRRANTDAARSVLLPAGALAALSQEGTRRLPDPADGGCGAGTKTGRGQSRPDFLAGWRQCLHQCGGVAGSTEEPPGDRAVELESRAVRPARSESAGKAGAAAEEGEPAAEPQGDDRRHRDLPRRVVGDCLPQPDPGVAGAGDPQRALVNWVQDRSGDGSAGARPLGPVAGRGLGG